MMLVDHNGDTIEFDAGEGEHSAIVTVREDKESATMVLRPDSAIALGAVLLAWGRGRQSAAGLF